MISLKQWGREIKWAWQRVFRGWDDTVTWNIDMHLNEVLPQWLRVLRDEGTGFPVCMYDHADWLRIVEGAKPEGSTERASGRWRYILSRMIAGFEAGQKLDQWEWRDENERQQLQAQLDEALKLFAEYYQALWD
jgi:hypothetical protein